MGTILILMFVTVAVMMVGINLLAVENKLKTAFAYVVLMMAVILMIFTSLSPGILKTHATQKKLAEGFPGANLEIKRENEDLYVTDGKHMYVSHRNYVVYP